MPMFHEIPFSGFKVKLYSSTISAAATVYFGTRTINDNRKRRMEDRIEYER